jgi:hypothetical protein
MKITTPPPIRVAFSDGVGTQSDDVAVFKITIFWRNRDFFYTTNIVMIYEANFGFILDTPVYVFKGINNINHTFFLLS